MNMRQMLLVMNRIILTVCLLLPSDAIRIADIRRLTPEVLHNYPPR